MCIEHKEIYDYIENLLTNEKNLMKLDVTEVPFQIHSQFTGQLYITSCYKTFAYKAAMNYKGTKSV